MHWTFIILFSSGKALILPGAMTPQCFPNVLVKIPRNKNIRVYRPWKGTSLYWKKKTTKIHYVRDRRDTSGQFIRNFGRYRINSIQILLYQKFRTIQWAKIVATMSPQSSAPFRKANFGGRIGRNLRTTDLLPARLENTLQGADRQKITNSINLKTMTIKVKQDLKDTKEK